MCITIPIHQLTDEQVVKLVLKDADLFLELMQRYEGRLLAYINRIINVSNGEAEDILQEVFIKTYQNLNGFDLNLKFSTWVYRITYNQVISFFRKNKKHTTNLTDKDSEALILNIADELNLKQAVAQKIDAKLIREAISDLDSKYRDVLVLKFLEDKDYNEISDIIKKPVATVGTLINRAKNKIKEALKQYDLT
ncbi:hypothetical protein COV81_05185 [Candidatus Peregrinibacteria bacterium CG11_big_fil_rev_8_21_14_0_20_41_10]|nr:MAG: hypothetical protein COV81_05185 [Candidatus Peregrinibacteria bacterium CG11_big_fil_rev_8_21_14_0_20_41_10]